MTLISLVLYLHVLAALLLAAAFSIEAVILTRLRRAANLSETDLWLTLIPAAPLMSAAALLVLLLSGGFLTARMAIWTLGWPRVAVGGTVLVAILGAATGRRMRVIRASMANSVSERSPLERFRAPFLLLSLHGRLWIVAGIVLLMSAKPDLVESLTTVAAAAILGSVSARLGSRPQRAPSALGGNVVH